MEYFISYKGKHLGTGMSKEEVQVAFNRLSRLFIGLEIVQEEELLDNSSSSEKMISNQKTGTDNFSSDQCLP